MIANNITELIGKTPMVKLNHVVPAGAADVYVKLEFFNPGGSVKDRIGLSMIEAAEQSGALKLGGTLIERRRATLASACRWSPPPRATT